MRFPVVEEIRRVGLVPVIKLDDPAAAVPLADALAKGGIPVAEVTFRAEGAERAIAAIAEARPDILLGAGTVITPAQVDAAVAAGAKFVVTPGYDPEVVERCLSAGVPVIPGCSDASDLSLAAKVGLDTVKFFPAEAAGGLPSVKALAGPFPGMSYIPTGGISPANLREYLSFSKVVACGGSWMAPARLIAAGNWDGIAALAREAVLTMLDIKLLHVGVYCSHETIDAEAEKFAAVLGAPLHHRHRYSYFAGESIEILDPDHPGGKGHIALSVTSVERAVRYFKGEGFAFDESSVTYGEDGLPNFIYFRDEIGGFGVHLKNA